MAIDILSRWIVGKFIVYRLNWVVLYVVDIMFQFVKTYIIAIAQVEVSFMRFQVNCVSHRQLLFLGFYSFVSA